VAGLYEVYRLGPPSLPRSTQTAFLGLISVMCSERFLSYDQHCQGNGRSYPILLGRWPLLPTPHRERPSLFDGSVPWSMIGSAEGASLAVGLLRQGDGPAVSPSLPQGRHLYAGHRWQLPSAMKFATHFATQLRNIS
jgi:hypothetical protein